MRIISCYIENFGCISRQNFDFEKGLTIFCHENGWGKTTLATFLKAMLYGLPTVRVRKEGFENERAYYAPWQGGRYGGSLTFSVGEKRYRVERTFAAKESSDEFALFDALTNLPSDDYTSALGEELFGVDADAFERSTYFSERSEHVKADYSDIQRRLVNVEDFERCNAALKALDECRKEYSKTGKRGKIEDLQRRLYDAQDQLHAAENAARCYAEGQRIDAQLLEKQKALLHRQAELDAAIKACADEKLRRTHAEQAERLRLGIEKKQTEYAILTRTPLPDAKAINETENRCRLLRDAEKRQAEVRTQAMVRREIAESENQRRIEECRSGQKTAEHALEDAESLLSRKKTYPFLIIAAGVLAVIMAVLSILLTPALPFLILLCLAVAVDCILIWRYMTAKRRVVICENAVKEAAAKTQQCISSVQETEDTTDTSDPSVDENRRIVSDFLLRYAPDCDATNLDRVFSAISDLRARVRSASDLSDDLRTAKEEYNAYLKDHPDLMREGTSSADEEALQKEAAACRDELKSVLDRDRANKREYTPYLHSAEQVPALEQEIADISETLPEYKHRLAVIQSAEKYLRQAKETLTAGYLDKVQQHFAAYVAAVSSLDNELRERTYLLTPDFEVKVNDGGTTRSEITVSRGTRDLLALCLRLALRDAVFTAEMPPLILDDPFTAYDDHRVKAAVSLLRALSEDQQIVYFVCHTSRA